MSLPLNSPCPCGRLASTGKTVRPYTQCCGQYLDSPTPAPDAQNLMRSRYCAFVLEREDYLLATWHSSQRPESLDFEPGIKWLGLDVRAVQQQDEDHATVEFVARHKPASGKAVRLHETSRFVREQGRWYYVDGDATWS
ncbi:hypothetical protein KIK84_06325 [Curvibacter sp. CHRR-16]|uniref:YchJ family protein n=1 Tax=Curvibacter sp. CHRR-16 TaxID=2835872 RepID=UPI001BD96248|nr:YchJ family metal-binding protein [Curvibacter sp. CHRR-16]MBT0569935.1 hypothetical protein [Curvibacter sp. CHRR-16]